MFSLFVFILTSIPSHAETFTDVTIDDAILIKREFTIDLADCEKKFEWRGFGHCEVSSFAEFEDELLAGKSTGTYDYEKLNGKDVTVHISARVNGYTIQVNDGDSQNKKTFIDLKPTIEKVLQKRGNNVVAYVHGVGSLPMTTFSQIAVGPIFDSERVFDLNIDDCKKTWGKSNPFAKLNNCKVVKTNPAEGEIRVSGTEYVGAGKAVIIGWMDGYSASIEDPRPGLDFSKAKKPIEDAMRAISNKANVRIHTPENISKNAKAVRVVKRTFKLDLNDCKKTYKDGECEVTFPTPTGEVYKTPKYAQKRYMIGSTDIFATLNATATGYTIRLRSEDGLFPSFFDGSNTLSAFMRDLKNVTSVVVHTPK